MGRRHGVLVATTVALVAACGGGASPSESPTAGTASVAEPPHAPEPAAAATSWIDASGALPAGWAATSGHGSVEELVESLRVAVTGELAPNADANLDLTVIGDDSQGEVGVLVTQGGAQDDSVDGLQLYLHVVEDGDGWLTDSAEVSSRSV